MAAGLALDIYFSARSPGMMAREKDSSCALRRRRAAKRRKLVQATLRARSNASTGIAVGSLAIVSSFLLRSIAPFVEWSLRVTEQRIRSKLSLLRVARRKGPARSVRAARRNEVESGGLRNAAGSSTSYVSTSVRFVEAATRVESLRRGRDSNPRYPCRYT